MSAEAPPALPVPEVEAGFSAGGGGARLFHRWHPASEPRAIVVFVHGLAEHSGRYLHVFEAFNAAGISCAGIDLRGHGRSSGRRCYIDSWSDYLDDVDTAIALARERGGAELPLFVFGHSMGGLIAATWSLFGRARDTAGVLLSSPGMGASVEVPAWKDKLGMVMSRLWPGLAIPTGLDANLVSRDAEVVTAYKGDPLVFTTATARWYTEFLAAQEQAFARASQQAVPMIVMQAGADGLVDPAASKRFFDALGVADKTWKSYDGLYHELVNEPEKPQVIEDMLAWMTERL